MRIETLARHRVPVGLVLLAASIWLAIGIQRTTDDAGAAVLDSPLRLIRARRIPSGWHLAPPGLFRISVYPVSSATFVLNAGSGGTGLVSREGTEVLARATLRYKIDPDRLLEVHASLGPNLEPDALRPWVLEALRDSIQGASYSAISGERTEELREALGRKLGERFRSAGLVLLSCDVSGVRIRSDGARATPSAGAQVHGMKVIVIGLDGADWNIIDPLMEAGKLPNLSRLARGGVRSRLRSITPMLSPVIWTSIATGVLPARHGIIDFLATTGREGERVPVTSGLRKVKAIWNILSERGISVGITAWWATYPAEAVKGYIVSDRVAYQLFGAQAPSPQAREGKVYPPDLDAVVSSLTIAPETINLSDLSRYIRITSDPTALPDSQSKLIEDFKTLLAAGDTYAQISTTLAQRFHPDFTGFYLEGTDTVSHLFMPYTPPLLQGVDKDGAQRFGRTVEEYYRHADDIVGKVVAAAEPGSAIIVCSDHGFRTGENRPLTDSRIGYGQAADWHRKYGILILSGDPFRKHETLEEASVLDITPTVLALFGLPVAEDMDGRPILDGFDPSFLRAHPVAYVPSYEGSAIPSGVEASNVKRGQPDGGGPDHPQTQADTEGEQNLKDKLRSLGYISENTANSHNNRGMVLLTQGRYDDAIAEFRKAAESSEDLSIAKINIARAYFKKKDYASALPVLEEHLKRHPRSKEAENLLGNIAMEQGKMDEAESHFKRALEYEPHFTDARNSLGILYDRQGRHDDALREFLKVVEVDKDYAESYNNIGVIYKNQGKIEDAVSWFRKAVEADAEFAGSYSNLALIYEDKGDLKAAEEQFRRAIKRDPHNAAVRTNFGALLYLENRFNEALKELESAVAEDPNYASAHNNLGAVYGRLGRVKEEIAAYRRAVALDEGYADVHHNLGLALLKEHLTDEGESELRRALSIDPRYGPGYLNLARSLTERGKPADAVSLLETAIRQVPKNPEIPALLGEILSQMGQGDKALPAFRRSLALKPNQPDIRSRIEQLESAVSTSGPASDH